MVLLALRRTTSTRVGTTGLGFVVAMQADLAFETKEVPIP